MEEVKPVVSEKIRVEHLDKKQHILKLSDYQEFETKAELNDILNGGTSKIATRTTKWNFF